jgi:hypothetical protein
METASSSMLRAEKLGRPALAAPILTASLANECRRGSTCGCTCRANDERRGSAGGGSDASRAVLGRFGIGGGRCSEGAGDAACTGDASGVCEREMAVLDTFFAWCWSWDA